MSSSHPIRYPVANINLSKREKEYLKDCINSNWISSSGIYIDKFEKLFGETFGSDYCVAVSSVSYLMSLFKNEFLTF